MCGINGIITADPDLKNKIIYANKLLRHRGPDDEGFIFINNATGKFSNYSGESSTAEIKELYPLLINHSSSDEEVVLAHRRLAIIDLSINGHCPMSLENGRLWITYNGEIYNYIELKQQLISLGHKFTGNSDTEVILHSYLEWGHECLNKFNGMWAFAIWDSKFKRLFAARDRFGVKPFYFSFNTKYFAFSSEIKPLINYFNKDPEIRSSKIPFYLIYGNRLNTNETYFKDIFSLPASSYLIFENNNVKVNQYYDIPKLLHNKSEEELKSELFYLLEDSVRLRFRSDVPVGTCLSGGFDSSSIVALSSRVFNKRLNTFSAVWDEKSCDESEYIDIVNYEFQCFPNKVIPRVNEFPEIFEKLCYFQEIPTEGPGLYPQWYVMASAKEKVKVLLDGQGGDEVFGGYFQIGAYLRSIIKDRKIFKLAFEFPEFFKFLNKNGIHSFSSWLFPRQYGFLTRSKLSEKFDIINKDLADSLNNDELYFDSNPSKKFGNYLSDLSYHFIRNITIPALLHYEDRSSMAHSIESRVPFLDYRLVELGVNLSSIQLSQRGVSRPLYRKALKSLLPQAIVNRKDKLGFPVPFEIWSKSTLKDYIIDNLNNNRNGLYNYINQRKLIHNLNEHFNGKKNYSWEIWRLLSLNNFLKIFSNKQFNLDTI